MRAALCQKVKAVAMQEAIVDNAAITTTEIDTIGFDHCAIYVYVGTTDIALTVLKVQESDTSGSGFADITGATFDSGTSIDNSTTSLPAATDDDNWFIFQIDLVGRKRYLDVSATVGNGTAGAYVTIFAILSKPDIGPSTSAGLGAKATTGAISV